MSKKSIKKLKNVDDGNAPMKMFTADPQKTGINTVLTINRWSGEFTEQGVVVDESKAKIQKIYGFLGVLKIFGKMTLFYIDQAELVATFDSHAIYKIKAVSAQIILYTDSSEPSTNQETDCIHQVSKYLKQSMFFSFLYDLTLDCLTQKCKDEKLKMSRSVRFWWNYHMLKSMFKQNISQEWCMRAIQGYAGSFKVELIIGKTLEYVLLSRREWSRGGTRYNHRGIDEDGNTANFVETEQIIRMDEIISSHIQVRGSVPIYWNQVGIRATSQLTKDFTSTKKGFMKHFEVLSQYYGNILCVNLMAKDKPNENIITTNFQDHLKSAGQEKISYQFIDFHNICKNYNFESLNPIIQKSQEQILFFSFSCFYAKQLRQEQVGVVRTNCLDCLDRTNVFMTKLALVMVQEMLVQMGVNVQKEFNSKSLLHMADVNEHNHPFIQHLKQTWADNGDAISKVYVGTNATTTKISKQGGGGWAGMFEQGMKGIERFYRQNFEDELKQHTYEMIVGVGESLVEQHTTINEDKNQSTMFEDQKKERKNSHQFEDEMKQPSYKMFNGRKDDDTKLVDEDNKLVDEDVSQQDQDILENMRISQHFYHSPIASFEEEQKI